MQYDINRDADWPLLNVARQARKQAYAPMDEPAEGAAVLVADDDSYVAVPGALMENDNYTNFRSATEAAISNTVARGYNPERIEQLAISRDTPRTHPLLLTTRAAADPFLTADTNDTHVTVEEDGDVSTFAYETLRYTTPNELAPELATDQWNDVEAPDPIPEHDGHVYDTVLADLSRDSMPNAYNPSSGYDVGAILLDADGHLHPGANIEPPVRGSDGDEVHKRMTIHGEEAALIHWNTFSNADPAALYIASADEGSPCGSCTQWMAQFLDDDTPVASVSADDHTLRTYKDYDPHPFRLQ